MAASSALLQSDYCWLIKSESAAWTAGLYMTGRHELRASHQHGHALQPTDGLYDCMSRHTQ
jgi:hypothetical protein